MSSTKLNIFLPSFISISKTALHYRCEFWPQNITAKKPSVTSDKIIAGVAPASGKYSSKMCINTLLNATSASNQQQLSYIGQRGYSSTVIHAGLGVPLYQE